MHIVFKYIKELKCRSSSLFFMFKITCKSECITLWVFLICHKGSIMITGLCINSWIYDKNFKKQPTSLPNKNDSISSIKENNFTLFPSLDEKLWKIRWGNCSDMVPTSGISCLITTLDRVKYAVGPNGRWHTMRPSAKRKQGSFQYSVLFIKWKIISDRYYLII